ncbi:polyprenyl synthetase family protein [Halovenus salina]|uniref:Polyprenyl synthetase family protein n=1 Tax=Halovenus salina TaxID=1510225 RepID=A0ABD5VVY1_9EURY|nr:polyprenyl synthetase family protein [Halovenus salina]
MENLTRHQDRIEARLESVLSAVEPPELRDQVEHVVFSGGKRVRPNVTLLVCEVLDGDVELAMDFAAGIELVHGASLVIDDIIDESELRRGTDSAWAAYGHPGAIIASNGLIGEALALFTREPEAMQAVTEAMAELGEGEATELADKPDAEAAYMQLARRKTGALFRASAELGAIAANADPYTVEAFGQYAERVGVAFQIRDDVLDATADAETLGKPTQHDSLKERPSIVEVTGLSPEEANERARKEAEQALNALEAARVDDQETVEYLQSLAFFVVERQR